MYWEAMKFNRNLLVVPEVNYTLHDGAHFWDALGGVGVMNDFFMVYFMWFNHV